MKPLAIIGLDPGTTSAYTILDLNRKILGQNSGKELTLSEMISQIIKFCQPLIVSTDKAKVPSFVEQFSAKMGTEIVSPPEDLLREEKRKMIVEWNQKGQSSDQHQEDSLAAALFAYVKYKPKLEKIRRFIQENHLEQKEQEFTQIALTEDFHFLLIKDLVTTPAEEAVVMKEAVLEKKLNTNNFLRLYQKIRELRDKNQRLTFQINQLQEEISLAQLSNKRLDHRSNSFDQRVDALFKFKEDRIKSYSLKIEELQNKLKESNNQKERLFTFIGKAPQYLLAKKMNSLSLKEFQEKNKILQINDSDFLWVEHPEIYSEQVLPDLLSKGVTLVVPKKVPFLEKRFPVALVSREEFSEENDYFILIHPEIIERNINKKDLIEKIIKEYREKRGN